MVDIGEELGEDGQRTNTREKLTKTVYMKINENYRVGYFAVGEFWHLKDAAFPTIKELITFPMRFGPNNDESATFAETEAS